MKSLKEAAASVLPKIDCQIVPFMIGTEELRCQAADRLARAIEDGWSIQFATSDAHSGAIVYTMVRTVQPEQAPVPGMRVS